MVKIDIMTKENDPVQVIWTVLAYNYVKVWYYVSSQVLM